MIARVQLVTVGACGDLIKRIGAPFIRGIDAVEFLMTRWNLGTLLIIRQQFVFYRIYGVICLRVSW